MTTTTTTTTTTMTVRRLQKPRPPPEPPPAPRAAFHSPSPVFTPLTPLPSPVTFDGHVRPPPLMSLLVTSSFSRGGVNSLWTFSLAVETPTNLLFMDWTSPENKQRNDDNHSNVNNNNDKDNNNNNNRIVLPAFYEPLTYLVLHGLLQIL